MHYIIIKFKSNTYGPFKSKYMSVKDVFDIINIPLNGNYELYKYINIENNRIINRRKKYDIDYLESGLYIIEEKNKKYKSLSHLSNIRINSISNNYSINDSSDNEKDLYVRKSEKINNEINKDDDSLHIISSIQKKDQNLNGKEKNNLLNNVMNKEQNNNSFLKKQELTDEIENKNYRINENNNENISTININKCILNVCLKNQYII
ncbi:hypothetical protein BCR32DRAFT_304817 [Anaeromyces robustus]|uniref:Uncharacterized protein n=1 Tax=Anaeromyces robustus TaxID=1754192 RepID=A0A1Y1WPF3_9FUNG|nr:hypothetical protein BCR32DRAFT_304817 [Anaeromyces robustus]|eukprot:ORX75362.1 hypothetical protein BCR32DRAFT_304817 [Anaeromyces robustus]